MLMTVASEARTDASRADLDAREDRNFDLSTFEAWFDAYVADNQEAMAIAERRFRPEFAVRSTPGGPLTRRRTQPRLAARPTCPNTDSRHSIRRRRWTRRRTRRSPQAVRRPDLRQLRPCHGVPRQCALPRGHQLPLPEPGCPLRAIALSAAVLVGALVQLAQLPRPPS